MTHNIYHSHNHSDCIQGALAQAKQLCVDKGVRLTAVRQRVFELIWQNHNPIGAYDILPRLAEEGFNSAPPTVYRALDFLLELGLIHRINSLNAFIGCAHPDEDHPVGFFVCRECGQAQELAIEQLHPIRAEVEAALGVVIEQHSTELTGLCPNCQQSQPAQNLQDSQTSA